MYEIVVTGLVRMSWVEAFKNLFAHIILNYIYSTIMVYFTSWAKLGSRQSVPGHIKLDLY